MSFLSNLKNFIVNEKDVERNRLDELTRDINGLLIDVNKFQKKSEKRITDNDLIQSAKKLATQYLMISDKLYNKIETICKNRNGVVSKLKASIEKADILSSTEALNKIFKKVSCDADIEINKETSKEIEYIQSWLEKFKNVKGGHFTVWNNKIADSVYKLSQINLFSLVGEAHKMIDYYKLDDLTKEINGLFKCQEEIESKKGITDDDLIKSVKELATQYLIISYTLYHNIEIIYENRNDDVSKLKASIEKAGILSSTEALNKIFEKVSCDEDIEINKETSKEIKYIQSWLKKFKDVDFTVWNDKIAEYADQLSQIKLLSLVEKAHKIIDYYKSDS